MKRTIQNIKGIKDAACLSSKWRSRLASRELPWALWQFLRSIKDLQEPDDQHKVVVLVSNGRLSGRFDHLMSRTKSHFTRIEGLRRVWMQKIAEVFLNEVIA